VNVRCVVIGLLAGIAAACSDGNSPVKPDPIDPGPRVINSPPVIGAFTVQGTRSNEPANFADLSEEIPVKVDVSDAESAIGSLTFNWSATVGSFAGEGASVVWKAPAQATTPTDVAISPEVVERYTSQGRTVENKVTGATTLSLHDSIKEVGEMARQFLLDFSDSSKSVAQVMRNFEPTCYGTDAETRDVTINRELFQIVSSNIGPAHATIAFGGICPYPGQPIRNKRGDACSRITAYWRSRFLKDNPESGNKVGDFTEAWGTDHIASMYYRDQKRWRLCDSQFEGSHTLRLRGLVP
jgi:hypothetical protein